MSSTRKFDNFNYEINLRQGLTNQLDLIVTDLLFPRSTRPRALSQ